jgi:hypothetical protein
MMKTGSIQQIPTISSTFSEKVVDKPFPASNHALKVTDNDTHQWLTAGRMKDMEGLALFEHIVVFAILVGTVMNSEQPRLRNST